MAAIEITDEQLRKIFKEYIESGVYTVEQIRKQIEDLGKNWPPDRVHFEYYRRRRH